MKIEYEDTFVKVAGLIGGPDYVRVARALLNNENATDEEIASATGLKIKTVRKSLYDLFPLGPAKQGAKVAALPQPYGKGGY